MQRWVLEAMAHIFNKLSLKIINVQEQRIKNKDEFLVLDT